MKNRFVLFGMCALFLAGGFAGAQESQATLLVVGDSTACNYEADRAPRTGWGQVLQDYFDPSEVKVVNVAQSGRSSKSFYEEGHWQRACRQLRAGDCVLIQFGHNDQKTDEARYTDPQTTYKEWLTKYIDEAKEKGAFPILLTSIHRNKWDGSTIKDSHGNYPPAMRELAAELNVPLIDLHAGTGKLFEELGPERMNEIFLILEPGQSPNYPEGVTDNTHLQENGARIIAGIVADKIKNQDWSRPADTTATPQIHTDSADISSRTYAVVANPQVTPNFPEIPNQPFKLTDFGAVPDDGLDDTDAFYKAFEAIEQAGGGRLVVEFGLYHVKQLTLVSKLNLHFEKGARLLFSGNPAAYQIEGREDRVFYPLVYAKHATDIAITGEGILDGNGECWWEAAREFKYAARAKGEPEEIGRPRLMIIEDSERILVQDVTLMHSPQITFMPKRCVDVTIRNIEIHSPEEAPNTDGIDPAASRRVLISGCLIDTGDDNIAIKSGNPEFGPVADMLIEDCTFRLGHGMSIGSETYGGVSNLTVRNCVFDGTDAGVRMKSARGQGGVCQNLVYENLEMRNVGEAITINSYYPDRTTPAIGGPDEMQPAERDPQTPVWRNIVIRNVTATTGRKTAGEIIGLPEESVSNITIENVRIEAPKGLRLREVDGLQIKNVELVIEKGDPWLLEPGERAPIVND